LSLFASTLMSSQKKKKHSTGTNKWSTICLINVFLNFAIMHTTFLHKNLLLQFLESFTVDRKASIQPDLLHIKKYKWLDKYGLIGGPGSG
jgi:hypothetical protein